MMPTSELEGISDLEIAPDFDATLELPATRSQDAPEETVMFGESDAPSHAELSETTSLEMIDGSDVADRLDELFSLEGSAADTTGMAKPVDPEVVPTETMEAMDPEAMVTGEEVASRLSEIFETPKENGFAAGAATELHDEDEDTMPDPAVSQTAATGQSGDATVVSPPLAPMLDEEDGYPDEEEMASQDGAGANVATVTLAEIYFQQGLKEQALQIYRQLLEREPGNESVRKRITEIEASKSDGENQGSAGQKPDPDPRRPRPGLKVPKRKK
jgi:hypothetical protein